MNTTTLLADPGAIRFDCIRPSLSTITLVVRATAPRAMCPRCQSRSSRVQSRYLRRVADLPWHGVAVKLELHTRRFKCQNSLCTQSIFCERLPSVVAHYARKTVRLNAALELIGFAVGGEAGARQFVVTAVAARVGAGDLYDNLARRLEDRWVQTAENIRQLSFKMLRGWTPTVNIGRPSVATDFRATLPASNTQELALAAAPSEGH